VSSAALTVPSRSGCRLTDSCVVALDAYGWCRAFILSICTLPLFQSNGLPFLRCAHLIICECGVAILVIDGVSCALPRSVSSLSVHYLVRTSSSSRFDQ